MNKLNEISTLIANYSRLAISLIAIILFLPAQMAKAGPCEDAQEYYRLWHDTDARAASMGLAGLSLFPQIARYKGMADAAAADCARLKSQQVTRPQTQNYGERGYGPERTGLDWQPFLSDLRPQAVSSQIQQGDNFANQGDWQAAANNYDLASRIDPNDQLARLKANEAHQKLNQAAQPQTEPPSSPDTGNQSSGSNGSAPPDTSTSAQAEQAAPEPQQTQPGSAPGQSLADKYPSQEQIQDRIKAQSDGADFAKQNQQSYKDIYGNQPVSNDGKWTYDRLSKLLLEGSK